MPGTDRCATLSCLTSLAALTLYRCSLSRNTNHERMLSMNDVQEPILDVAHLGHVELLSPKPEESLRFFRDVLSMQEAGREGQSVYLRGWGDYERYSLKLTEAKQAGLGH